MDIASFPAIVIEDNAPLADSPGNLSPGGNGDLLEGAQCRYCYPVICTIQLNGFAELAINKRWVARQLAIPAIAGASVLALKDVVSQYQAGITMDHSIHELAAGALVSFIVGIVALRWLIVWSRQDRLHWFATWCIPVGMIVLVLCLRGHLG